MNTDTFPLFPLGVVMFPEGILPLRIFEARYLDMVRACLRNKSPFGVVAAQGEVDPETGRPFAAVGTSFSIIETEVPHPGLMNIRCRGGHRFRVRDAHRQPDGLWIGEVEEISDDPAFDIPPDLMNTRLYLQQVIDSLIEQRISEQDMPFGEPFRMDDCAWVANRWCEILAIPLIQKQRLLELDSPLVRLELVQDMLNEAFSGNSRP